MAKISRIVREEKLRKTIEKFAEKRARLKNLGDYEALDKLPKNASPIRVRRRCKIDGRPRGFIRKLGISRIYFRELMRKCEMPGFKKVN